MGAGTAYSCGGTAVGGTVFVERVINFVLCLFFTLWPFFSPFLGREDREAVGGPCYAGDASFIDHLNLGRRAPILKLPNQAPLLPRPTYNFSLQFATIGRVCMRGRCPGLTNQSLDIQQPSSAGKPCHADLARLLTPWQ